MAVAIDDEVLVELFPVIENPCSVSVKDVVLAYDAQSTQNNHFSLRLSELEIRAGVIHCIYGTNGCGKTTLLRALAGIMAAQEGRITWSLPAPPRPGVDHVLVTQAGPMPHWSVGRNIAIPMVNQGTATADIVRRTGTLVQLLGLQDLENRYAHQLSAGQQQRTVLARALSIAPPILLLDEIMSGQSEYWSARIGELLAFYVRRGRMVVMVSHDPEWVLACADRVTNIVSDTTDAISATRFFLGYDGPIQDWQAYREARLRRDHE